MRWSERQVVMLREMGVRLWEQPQPDPFGAADGTPRPSAGREAGAAVMAPAVPVTANATSVVLGAVTGMGWDELREAVVGCTACGLCKGRRQAVFGVGNQRADWMIVGEAPGEQEDIQGEPFVGKSGQLLDNMLRAIGLGRADLPGDDAEAAAARQVYIANTIKCRPPGNRNPEPDELARCEPFLVRQLQLVQPKIIVAMGRFAVQSLLRSSEPIGRLRGRVHQYQGVPLIVTYHPAYLLRNPEEKAKAWDDLCLARATAAAGAAA
jgi:uracil-DNA glycosylase family 4